MELHQLRCFSVLARELHFARAAEKLGITQPPLSRNIQNLEKELGVRLLARENKWKIELTEAGRLFLPEAEEALRRVAHAKHLAREAAAGERGKLTIGAISSAIGHTAFIDALAKMEQSCPDAVVEIIDSTSGALEKLVAERSVDLALMRLGDSGAPEDMQAETLYSDTLLAVLPRGHHLAKRRSFPVSALKNEHFILVPGTVSAVFRSFILNICQTQGGFTPTVSHEISNSYTALRLTAAGAGVTMVSSAYEGMFSDRLVYRRFSDSSARIPLYAVHPVGETTPLARRFLNLLHKELAKRTES